MNMTRKQKLQFCIESCIDLVREPYLYLLNLSDEDLDKEVDWFDYLWEK